MAERTFLHCNPTIADVVLHYDYCYYTHTYTALPAARRWSHRISSGPHQRAGHADQAGVRQVRRVQ